MGTNEAHMGSDCRTPHAIDQPIVDDPEDINTTTHNTLAIGSHVWRHEIQVDNRRYSVSIIEEKDKNSLLILAYDPDDNHEHSMQLVKEDWQCLGYPQSHLSEFNLE